MSFKYNQVVLPFALWSGTVPTHNITCAVFIGVGKIATGSETGVICIWEVQQGKLVPEFLLTGHTAPITALVHDVYSKIDCITSVSQDGTLCLWDTQDGLCLKSADKLLESYSPTSMASVGDNRRVVVSGRSHQAAIINVTKMEIESQQANHDHWISGVFPSEMKMSSKEHIFLSLCKGILRFWTLTEERALAPVQTIVLDIEHVQTVFVCPTNITFIVVSSEFWALFAASNSYCIQRVRCPYPCGWSGGRYVDSYHAVLWTLDGHACLYRLPDISKNHPLDFGHGSDPVPVTPSPNLEFSVLLYTFAIDDPTGDMRTRLLGSQVICCVDDSASCLSFADERGALTLFEIPKDLLSEELPGRSHEIGQPGSGQYIEQVDPDSVQEIKEVTSTEEVFKPISLTPTMRGCINETWEPLRTPERVENPTEPQAEVTVSRIISDTFSLIRGYSDGTISVHTLPQDPSPRVFPTCHHGKVTALMKVHLQSDDSNLLISGGEDCLIHAWDLSTGEKLCTWPQHCGTILQLLRVPPQNDSLQSIGCFLSVASDFSIGLFSYDPPRAKALNMFTGHKAAILSVQLRLDQDYLFVTCADETVTIWELSTGQYEGCYPADSLNEITQMAMTELSMQYSPTQDLQSDIHASVTLYSSDISPPRPCAEILLFNIRQLIEETHRRSQFNLDTELKETLRFYSFLIPWGISNEVDKLASSLGISPPSGFASLSTGLYGDNGKITLFLPNSRSALSPFSLSPRTTAIFLLSALSFTDALLQTAKGDTKTICCQLLSQFGALLPERIVSFVPPCLGFLTNFWRDKIEDIQQAARSLFFSTLDRQSHLQRSHFIARWSERMKSSDRHNIKSKAIPGLLLGIVVANRTEILESAPKELPQQIAASLTRLVLTHPETSYQLIAAEILARGYPIWGDFVTNESRIFQHLMSVITPSVPGKLSPTEKSIWILATQMPHVFVNTVSNVSKTKAFSPAEYLIALRVTNKLLRKIPFSIIDDLIIVVEYIIRSQNPKLPCRQQCLKLSNSLIMLIVEMYPMASYDSDTQRLAIGTVQKTISMYDLKTCARAFNLAGHNAPVTAVSFAADGKTLASYASGESLVCFWSCGSQGIWFSSPPRCLKGLVVAETMNVKLRNEDLGSVSLDWNSPNTVKLTQGEIVALLTFN